MLIGNIQINIHANLLKNSDLPHPLTTIREENIKEFKYDKGG